MVHIHDIHGKTINSFSMNINVSSSIIEYNFWGNGLVVIASDWLVYVAEV
jgi:hypothetical protein